MRLDSPPHTTAIAASARLLVLVVALLASSCKREITCTTEVTAGSGTFRGSAGGARPEVEQRRESLRIACGEMCARGGPGKTDGCVSRCVVDVESRKIGARTTCKEGSGR